MNNIKLTRLNEPNFDELFKMISEIRAFLDEEVDSENTEWMENLEIILDFQDTDGSFKLFSTYEIPSDARVDFCHMPTYICTSILMKAYLTGNSTLSEKVEKPLIQGLEMCYMRNLTGHGYEGLQGQIEALNIFIKGGLREFLDLHPNLNPKFKNMIRNIRHQFGTLKAQEKFKGPWGRDHKEDILKINKYFNTRRVFVYGTLMKGEANHLYLKNSTCLGAAILEGYEMYDVGWYPAIIPGDGRIIGELYEVPKKDIPLIDRFEDEGNLYIRKYKITSDKALVYIYEYAKDTTGLEKISSWKDYIWYVSYGSNMLSKRFLCYIEGGVFEDSGSYRRPCDDNSSPIERKPIEIPYDMYFGNQSRSWRGCGVSFLDTTKKGHAYGVAYLITREQFEHVAAEENGGHTPGYGNWYEDIKNLGEMDGFESYTITNDELRPYYEPCEDYLRTLKRGMGENWPKMSEEDINNYLDSCIRK